MQAGDLKRNVGLSTKCSKSLTITYLISSGSNNIRLGLLPSNKPVNYIVSVKLIRVPSKKGTGTKNAFLGEMRGTFFYNIGSGPKGLAGGP